MNNRKIFSKNLNNLIVRSGKNKTDIAADLNVSPTTFGDWTNEKSFPRAEALAKIANYFNVTTADLLINPDELIDLGEQTYEIPVYKEVRCGNPSPETDEVIGYINIDVALSKRGEYFAVRAKGDSMAPEIKDGDILIIRKQKTINSGNVAIIKVNGDSSTCKRVIIRTDGLLLQALNTNYEPVFYSKEQIDREPVEILGRVIEVRKRY